MENIVINQEFYEEYKDRVEELQGIFINIYSNYFYLIHIGEQRKTSDEINGGLLRSFKNILFAKTCFVDV